MAGLIPPEFIDQLLSRIDIVDVIESRVPLKKAGREFQACCPFHTEKTPSFTVSPQKQFYHCFGCGAHGTAISFLMDYDQMGFVEAIEELAKQAGMEVPRSEEGKKGPDTRPLFETLDKANQFFQQQLRSHKDAARAVDYLKQRGLSGEIAKEFGLGFAPPGWDNLIKHLGNEPSGLKRMQTVGLTSQKENGNPYDKFRDRIMFPIIDTRGRVVGFGGRVLDDGSPKYLNSPETPVFHKSEILYGLYEARRANHGKDHLIVVEGYMDVVALAQFGIRNAVATLGTATTERHLGLLFRAVPKVVFCFDGDRAGRAAAWKALNNALPTMQANREARFLFLPEGEDPDTLIRKQGPAAFEAMVEESQPLSEYLFQHLAEGIDTTTLDGRARLADNARPLIERIPEGTLKQMMMRRLGDITGTGQPRATVRAPQRKRPRGAPSERLNSPVRLALRLMLENPRLIDNLELPEGWDQADVKGVPLLKEIIELALGNPHLTGAVLVERWRGSDIGDHLVALASVPVDIPEEGLGAELAGCFRRMAEQVKRQQFSKLTQMSYASLSDEQKQLLAELQKQLSGEKKD